MDLRRLGIVSKIRSTIGTNWNEFRNYLANQKPIMYTMNQNALIVEVFTEVIMFNCQHNCLNNKKAETFGTNVERI